VKQSHELPPSVSCRKEKDYHLLYVWSLVADSLLSWLTKQGVFAQGFADDGVVLIVWKIINTICFYNNQQ